MSFLKKTWDFIWHSNSIWSWIVNVILAFLLVKFLVYPGVGFLLHTSHPVVAVVSGSMEHKTNFDEWWSMKGNWYVENGLDKEEVKKWAFLNGFNKGDLMILKGVPLQDIKVGQVIVYRGVGKEPIIHRVVKKWIEDNKYFFQTKGDHNDIVWNFENRITEEQVIGKAVLRVPLLGWVKIWSVNLINLLRSL